jgi:putative ABC transport system permease protein
MIPSCIEIGQDCIESETASLDRQCFNKMEFKHISYWHGLRSQLGMLKSYLRIAFRSLRKNKVYTSINITGLAVGLSVFWLMALYISDELRFDRSSANADRIYRVVHSAEWSGGSFHLAQTPATFGPALKKDFSDIEAMARVNQEGGGTLIYGEKKIDAGDIVFADATLLSVFHYPFLAGDPEAALAKPNSLVLTRGLAEKIFGNADDALNKTVTFQHDETYLITGVMEDVPENSQLRFSALRSMPLPLANDPNWMNSQVYTYVLLKKDAPASRIAVQLPAFVDHYIRPAVKNGESYQKYSVGLQPLTSIHLHSNLDYESSRNGDIRYVYLFSAVALLILVIAVINYINLATARSSVRVKEIGVRKVVGSGRRQLVSLFLTESVLFTSCAAFIAVTLTGLLMPAFNGLSGKNLSVWQFGMAPTLLVLVLFSVFVGLTGGIYPALFLSGFRTIPALKGQQGNLQSTVLFRKSLVTFQFVITIILIAGSSILYWQLHYMLTKDLGFNKDQVLSFHIHNKDVRNRVEELKTQLLRDPSIEAASAAGNPIGGNDIGEKAFQFEENGAISPTSQTAQTFYIDADYLPALQIRLASGRNFSKAQPTDQYGSVLVNETLVRKLGWTDAVGKRVRLQTGADGHMGGSVVIGVVKDFSIYSLQHKIEPLVLQMPPVAREEDNLYVRVDRNHVARALKYMEATVRSFDPASSFEYHFLDENFAHQYATEQKQGQLLLIFTALAIFIAGLGLFGLVTFSVGQRTKEIGIRKVLGASVTGIVALVSWDLIKPVGIAILIATPIAWYAMERWLESFPYRIGIHLWIFLAAGLLAALIAMLTVGLRAMGAARANPTRSLRSE